MKNFDLGLLLILGLFLAGIWAISQRYPAGGAVARDRKSPLPSGKYTSGSVGIPGTGGMTVQPRVNFQEQPYGSGNYS